VVALGSAALGLGAIPAPVVALDVTAIVERLAALVGRETGDAAARGLDGALAAVRREAAARAAGPDAAPRAAPGAAPGTASGAPAPLVAVSATAAGHVTFALPSGETYTAGTAAERSRAATTVLPGVADGFAAADMVLSLDTLFTGPDTIRTLPAARSLQVAYGDALLPVERRVGGLLALRPGRHLAVPVTERSALALVLDLLRRPIETARMRVIAATERAPATLSAAPRMDPTAATPLEDAADADRLPEAVASIPRQTAILTAKVVGRDLRFDPPSGARRTVSLADLVTAAATADVDLFVLDTDPPRQTGGRTWLYRSVTIAGATRALRARTVQDLLDVLAEARGGFDLAVTAESPGRVRLVATASATRAEGWMGAAAAAADRVTGEVMGALRPTSVVASLVDPARRIELAWRLVPGVPSAVQWGYAVAVLIGLVGWRPAQAWFHRLWPAERREEYAGAVGYGLAWMLRLLVFVVVFVPVAGAPAALHRTLGGRPT
jgi:hypothetical protein